MKDVDDAAVMILSFSPIQLTCWAYAEAEESERIIMNWYKLNQIVKPVATAVLYVLSLLQQISAILGTWYIQLLIRQMLFYSNLHQKLLSFP